MKTSSPNPTDAHTIYDTAFLYKKSQDISFERYAITR